MRSLLLAIIVVTWPIGIARGQGLASDQSGPVHVLIDCVDMFCDRDFLQSELTFVEHVRARQDADVHVLITSEPAGSGGRQLTFTFIGLGRFTGRDYVLRHTTLPAESDDAIRRDIVRVLSVGLGPYLLESPNTNIALPPRLHPSVTGQPPFDPWDSWTFRAQFGGNGSAEESTRLWSANGSFNANRTTDAMKLNLTVTGAYTESSFDLPTGDEFVSRVKRVATDALYARSIGRHWAVGVRGSLSSASFENLDYSWYLAPAVEFDVFPYAESTRRLLTVHYTVGVRAFDYEEETLFGKLREQTAAHALTTSLTLRQPWGTVASGLEATSFLPQWRQNRVSGWGEIDINLVKGLSVLMSGEVGTIRDQVFLPRGEATTEEVLVRQRQLPTTFRVFYTFGLSYTFGSIYSAVVNPRMRRGGF